MNLNKYRSVSHYRITPLLMRAGVEETVTVLPLGESRRFDDNTDYTVSFIPKELYDCNRLYYADDWDKVTVRPRDGIIRVSYVFEGEQEWTVSVISAEDIEKKKAPLELYVYSLFGDLYERTPYMGDLHVHSCRSDGKEDPAIVAANYRKEGFDFMALTDHERWYASDDMIKAYEGIKLGIRLFHGEEVHVPSRGIHIVNFGGRYGVTDMYRQNAEDIDSKVKAEAEKLQVPCGVNALEFAYRKWTVEEIRRAGGMAIMAHPHWVYKQTYNMSISALEYAFEMGLYDAFEIIGGIKLQHNNLQTVFYYEQTAKGRRIPIVGSSDSHGTDPANFFCVGKTVVFAKDTEFNSVCGAIKDMYSVAIEQRYGEEERVFGSYRMVKYAIFLLEHYFPLHNELCAEEGVLMREYILGDKSAGEALSALSGRVAKYSERILRGAK